MFGFSNDDKKEILEYNEVFGDILIGMDKELKKLKYQVDSKTMSREVKDLMEKLQQQASSLKDAEHSISVLLEDIHEKKRGVQQLIGKGQTAIAAQAENVTYNIQEAEKDLLKFKDNFHSLLQKPEREIEALKEKLKFNLQNIDATYEQLKSKVESNFTGLSQLRLAQDELSTQISRGQTKHTELEEKAERIRNMTNRHSTALKDLKEQQRSTSSNLSELKNNFNSFEKRTEDSKVELKRQLKDSNNTIQELTQILEKRTFQFKLTLGLVGILTIFALILPLL